MDKIIQDLLSKAKKENALTIEPLPYGFNSLIYKVITKEREYLAKKYITRDGDLRDRFQTEFFGISFLWSNGIRAIPEPICGDKEKRIAIYRFINGNKLNPEEITENEIYQALGLLREMHRLTTKKEAKEQPIASEACFKIKDYIDCVEERIGKLMVLSGKNDIFEALKSYLEKDFIPFFTYIKEFVEKEARRLNIDTDRPIEENEKTLSPSDFGFHNVIKKEDGSLVFIDFEYYGWDDSVKLIADFYLQPAVPVPLIYRKVFFEGVYEYLKNKNLFKRLPLVYPILSLKWCLIILNAFLRQTSDEICAKQLKKAKNKLEETKKEFENKVFPYEFYET